MINCKAALLFCCNIPVNLLAIISCLRSVRCDQFSAKLPKIAEHAIRFIKFEPAE